MLEPQQEGPARDRNPNGVEELRIWVRIFIAPDRAGPLTTPAHNRIATWLLSRLLRAKMEAVGALVAEASYGFEFNRAYYSFVVSDLHAGLSAIKAELEEMHLLGSAQIAWGDPREAVFRLAHSKTTEFLLPSDAEMKAEASVMAGLSKMVEKALRPKDDNAAR